MFVIGALTVFAIGGNVNHSETGQHLFKGKSVHHWIKLSEHSDPVVRESAAYALGHFKSEPKTISALVKLLDDDTGLVRSSAVWAVSQFEKDSKVVAIPALCKLISTSRHTDIHGALSILRDLKKEAAKALPKLIAIFPDKSYHWNFRRQLPFALWSIGPNDDSVIETLHHGLKDSDGIVQLNCAWVLWKGGRKKRESFKTLKNGLDRKEVPARGTALEYVAELGDLAKPCMPRLLILAKDNVPAIRLRALRALVNVAPENPKVIQTLIIGLKDEYHTVRRDSAYFLGKLGGKSKKALPILMQVLMKEEDGFARLTIAYAVWQLDSNRLGDVLPVMVQGLQSTKSSHVRAHAAELLGNIGPTAKLAIPSLTRALDDEFPEVQKKASEALGKIRGVKNESREKACESVCQFK